MVTGGAVAGAGASITDCVTDRPCWPARWALFGGGLGFAAAVGGTFLGVGLRVMRKSLPEPSEGRADVAAFRAGLALMIVGGVAAGVGLGASLVMGCTDSRPSTCAAGLAHPLPEIALPVGITLLASGAPFAALGGRQGNEREPRTAELRFTGSGFSARW